MNLKDVFAKGVTRVHNTLYRMLDGKGVDRWGKAQMLLLTTTGRKTGKARTTPLLFIRDGESIVLVASYGGDDRDPLWYRNLVANPVVTIEIGREKSTMTARTANPEERARIWPELVSVYKQYESYQRKTDREIPLAILSHS